MKKLFPLLVAVSFLSWACEDDEDSGADCTSLGQDYAAAFEAWTTAVAAGEDGTTECEATVAAYQAGVDAGCEGYTEEGVTALGDCSGG